MRAQEWEYISVPLPMGSIYTRIGGRSSAPPVVLVDWTSTVSTFDEIRTLWAWAHARSQRTAAPPEIFLGFCEQDVFVEAHRLLASSLPAARVLTAPGGHRWPTWQALWKQFPRLRPWMT